MDAIGNPKTKSCRESAKREGDILKPAEMAANDKKQEDEEKHNINKLFKQLRKEKKEKDEARALWKKCRKIWRRPRPEPLQRHRSYRAGTTSTRGRGPHFTMDKIWQMSQSNDTKSLNLTNDFEELLDVAQQAGWLGPTKP